MENYIGTVEKSLFFSHYVKHTLIYIPEILLLGIYPAKGKIMFIQNGHANAYTSFIHSCPNLKTTQVSFNR